MLIIGQKFLIIVRSRDQQIHAYLDPELAFHSPCRTPRGLTLTWRDLADRCWVPAVALVAVGRLDENGTVAKALGKHLAADVVESHSSAWETQGAVWV